MAVLLLPVVFFLFFRLFLLYRLFCRLDDNGSRILRGAFDSMGLSARGHDRILRVARTVADLDGQELIGAKHVAEAIQLRSLDRKYF